MSIEGFRNIKLNLGNWDTNEDAPELLEEWFRIPKIVKSVLGKH